MHRVNIDPHQGAHRIDDPCSSNMVEPHLYPYFLGPYGENDALLEKLVVEFLRDHVYWRRNFHPEDPPAIPTRAAMEPAFLEFEARLRRELHMLSAALKHSVPFHSPRYLGHMVSDLLLPGLAAQILTLPYNPNNVSEDAAPVTIDLEIQVGLQLARLIGYPHDPARPDCAFGHLTSGGTLANVQAMRLALSLKAFPVALRAAAPPELAVPDDDWAAFNLSPAQAIELLVRWETWIATLAPPQRRHYSECLARERLEARGHADFFLRHPQIAPPVVLAPASAHYSWPKTLKLLGLGTDRWTALPQRNLRIDLDALDEALEHARAQRQPVLMAVAMLGTTEFGAIDPVAGVLAARERAAASGLGFAVHVDAAWGGYLATLFREPDGAFRSREAVARSFLHFPSDDVYSAFAALGRADSVTIDPHKLGYVPYGAGAFVCRDHRAMSLLAAEADYVFARATPLDYLARYRQLGRYVPEGSKPGAIAAAVYVVHRVLPLDHTNFGQLPAHTLKAVEAFLARAKRFAVECSGWVHACVPFEPDCNLVCLAINPRGNAALSGMNAFVERLHRDLRIDPAQPLQTREFFGSTTTLRLDILGLEESADLLRRLGLAVNQDIDAAEEQSHVTVLRHTLMNPFVLDTENGISYIDRYFDFLARRVRALCDSARV